MRSLAILSVAAAVAFPISGCKLLRKDSSAESINIPWDQNNLMEIGRGVDALSGSIRGRCLKFDPKTDYNEPVGGNFRSQTWGFELIQSREELEKKLDISAAAKMQYGPSKGSVKAKFSEETKSNSFAVYAILNVTVRSGTKMLSSMKFIEEALELIRNNQMDAFRAMCGDEYVAAASYGGEFFALLEFHAGSAEAKRLLEVDVSAASGSGPLSGELDSQVKSRIRSLAQRSQLNIRGFQIAGTFTQITNLMNVESMIQSADRFIQEMSKDINNNSPLVATTDSYSSVPVAIANRPTLRSIATQQEYISDLDRLRGQIRTKLDDIDYILTHDREFQGINSTELQNARNILAVSRDKLYAAANSCFQDIAKCGTAPQIEIPTVTYPKQASGTVISARPSCEPKLYKLGEGEVCVTPSNPPIYKTAQTSNCGTMDLLPVRHELCGVERRASKAAAPCPPAEFKLKRHHDCGVETTKHSQNGCPDEWVLTREPELVDTDRKVYVRPGECTLYKACRIEANGAESYHTCEHESFEPVLYKACVKKEIGIGQPVYSTCAHPNHGRERWPSCRHKDFGTEDSNQCSPAP